MIKQIIILFAGSLTLFSCVKHVEGCTDETALNYDPAATQDNGTCEFEETLEIGQSHAGGIIIAFFSPSDSGYVEGEDHGIVAATMDCHFAPGASWGCSTLDIMEASNVGLGYGSANTTAILDTCEEVGTAASLCDNLVIGGRSDWHLPSKNELVKIRSKQNFLGGIVPNREYWSSTNVTDEYAYYVDMSEVGGGASTSGKWEEYKVRAVRYF